MVHARGFLITAHTLKCGNTEAVCQKYSSKKQFWKNSQKTQEVLHNSCYVENLRAAASCDKEYNVSKNELAILILKSATGNFNEKKSSATTATN